MIYVIHGQEEYFIRQKIAEITSSNDSEIIEFDGLDRNFSIQQMLDACVSNSIFYEKTIVLVNQPFFLVKKCDDDQLEMLKKYVDNPLYETDLVLYTYSDNFNSRLKAYKMILNNAQEIICGSLDNRNFGDYARSRLNEEGIKLNNESVSLLINICKRNATLLNQNIEILKLYPDTITTQALISLCTAADESESFDLINALTNSDISTSIRLVRKMMNDNDSILGIISLLSGQLRYLYHVGYLSSIGKKKYEIQEITGSKEYRVSMALKTLENLSLRQIMELLHQLSDLDCKSKSDNSLSDVSRFELFILNLLNRGNHAVNQTTL